MGKIKSRVGWHAWLGCLLTITLAAVAASAAAGPVPLTGATPGSVRSAATVVATCPQATSGSAVALAGSGEAVYVDVTGSTSSPTMRRLYAAAAVAVVERAVAEKAALRIVAFGASGVGARVLFDGSFADTSADEVFNLAARNRQLCLAQQAVAAAVGIRPDPLGGSDVSGSISAGIEALRGMVKPDGTITLNVWSDGCQSPAARGPNRTLTNWCGQLAKGRSVAAILRAHALEFTLPDARGVAIVMRGIGVGAHARFASTLFAQRLIGFWETVCRRAHAHACVIESGLS